MYWIAFWSVYLIPILNSLNIIYILENKEKCNLIRELCKAYEFKGADLCGSKKPTNALLTFQKRAL